MAFLDNSGDIILDAVLTDTGRLRLAQGDGSFKISKFALADDEINYGNYDKNHSSGSAYFDLEVLQTPVLEAFSNNTSNLKTKLVSIPRTNLLYMPILKLNKNSITTSIINTAQQQKPSKTFSRNGDASSNTLKKNGNTITYTAGAAKQDAKFYVAVDSFTYDQLSTFQVDAGGGSTAEPSADGYIAPTGIIEGYNSGVGAQGGIIRVDHGLDTNEISPSVGIDSDLQENAFIVELDYRLGRLKSPSDSNVQGVNFIDDDQVATYYVGSGPMINPEGAPSDTNTLTTSLQAAGADEVQPASELSQFSPQVFDGPRGSTFQFRIQASLELQQSTYLFNQIGQSEDAASAGNLAGFSTVDSPVKGKKIYYIDSTVRVIGANTGYRLDIPIRFIKIAN